MESSPRTWGCFPEAVRLADKYEVFPTHVGVFLTHKATPKNGMQPHRNLSK